ncbi:MAG: DUF501 domain-containing protein, partial [Candidatus Muiribacteriota bacterium]
TKLSEYIKENVEIFKSQTKKYSHILEKTAENKLGYVPENIKELGVGGISDIMFPKCLHAHFAYYLIDKSYIAGEFINKNIESLNCDNNYCKEQEEVKK